MRQRSTSKHTLSLCRSTEYSVCYISATQRELFSNLLLQTYSSPSASPEKAVTFWRYGSTFLFLESLYGCIAHTGDFGGHFHGPFLRNQLVGLDRLPRKYTMTSEKSVMSGQILMVCSFSWRGRALRRRGP
jgi:hypothetical protein